MGGASGTKWRFAPMKCPICDEELTGTESCCPTCTWDLHRKPNVIPIVIIGVVILCAVAFLYIKTHKTQPRNDKVPCCNNHNVVDDVASSNDSGKSSHVCTTNVQPLCCANVELGIASATVIATDDFGSNNNTNQENQTQKGKGKWQVKE